MNDPLYFGRDGEPLTLWEWADRFDSDRHVAHAVLESGHEVRTIWFGSHRDPLGSGPPLIFGTVVSPPPRRRADKWHEVRRYATEAEAMAGHDEIVGGYEPDRPAPEGA